MSEFLILLLVVKQLMGPEGCFGKNGSRLRFGHPLIPLQGDINIRAKTYPGVEMKTKDIHHPDIYIWLLPISSFYILLPKELEVILVEV